MVETVKYLNEITDTFVQQANTDLLIPRRHVETFEKASLEFAIKIAAENGFPDATDHRTRVGYSRPLVIARAIRDQRDQVAQSESAM